MTQIWVVMGNDYPDSVFSTQERASQKIKEVRGGNRRSSLGDFGYDEANRVYWRYFEFELDKE